MSLPPHSVRTFADIRAECRSPNMIPREAVTAMASHLDVVAEAIHPLVAELRKGVTLVPSDEAFVMFGLHALAAARRIDCHQDVVALMRVPLEEQLELFSMSGDVVLGRLYVSTWDGDVAALLRLIEHADVSAIARAALFHALARLTFEGRLSRPDVAAFLAAYAEARITETEDAAWFGWERAVARLGVTDLRTRLDEVSRFAIYDLIGDAHRTEIRALLQRASAKPDDPIACDLADLAPIADVLDALAWVEREPEADATADTDTSPDSLADAGAAHALGDDEMTWLLRFLDGRTMPMGTMTIEMLDGFLTAHEIGPVPVSPTVYLPTVFDRDGAIDDVFRDPEQARYVMELIARTCKAIAARRDADTDHLPLTFPDDDGLEACDWADGFLIAVGMNEAAWAPIYDHPRAGEALQRVFDLAEHPDAPRGPEEEPPPSAEVRAGYVETLPMLIRQMAAYWRNPKATVPPLQQPMRSSKVGRNDPCPCGSGKKFKKCHGAIEPNSDTLH